MKKILLFVILLANLSFPQFYHIDSTMATATGLRQVPGNIETAIDILNSTLYTKQELDGLLTILHVRIDALFDSVAALRAVIGSITPTTPAAPTSLLAVSDGTDIDISWDDGSDSYDSTEVFYSTGITSNYSLLGAVDSGVVTISDLAPIKNQIRWYYAKKIKAGVYSAPSNIDTSFVYEATGGGGGTEGDNGWFVDNTASGGNDGTNWTDAWESFADINWSALPVGDTIYVSGGSDSTVYNETLNIGKSGTNGNIIVVTKGLSETHNGKVVIDGQLTRSNTIETNGYDYITISYLKITNWTDNGIDMDGSSNALLSHCEFYQTDGQECIRIRNSTNVIVEYCVSDQAETPANSYSGNGDFMQAALGGEYTFRYNTVTLRNTVVTDHCDAFQFYFMTGDAYVYGNFYQHLDTKTTNAQGIFLNQSTGMTLYVYNNVAYFPYSKSPIGLSNNTDVYTAKLVAIGNTIYLGTGTISASCIWLNNPVDDNIIENNILVNMSSSGLPISIVGGTSSGNVIDYNILYAPNSSYVGAYSGNKTWANWQALGFDVNGYNENPDFVSVGTDPLGYKVQIGSSAIDNGATMGSPYNIDILEIARPQGSAYDIGAYEQ